MRLAFIVPYRNRSEHLKLFTAHYKNLIPESKIYIIEQYGNGLFNRARLFNCGFKQYKSEFDYFAAHDIDMLTTQVENYSFPNLPTHIATKCSQFNYKLPYKGYFGGVVLFSNSDFERLNGFTNLIYGWGNEDDEMLRQIKRFHMRTETRKTIYKCLDHERNVDWNLYRKNKSIVLRQRRIKEDGLTHCNYEVVEEKKLKDYTHLIVKID